MSSVDVTARVEGRDRGEVFDLVSDFGRYADVCPEVRRVDVEPAGQDRIRSTWEVDFRDGVLMWTEEDLLDRAAGTITFVQVDGDFEEFAGAWTISDDDGGVRVSFHAEFDMGIASLRAIIEPIAERSLRESIGLILTGVLGADTVVG